MDAERFSALLDNAIHREFSVAPVTRQVNSVHQNAPSNSVL
jgi:hypothetical protein